MIQTHCLGLPRIGPDRELKFALEKFWKSKITHDELEQTAKTLRLTNWQKQIQSGLDFIQVGDFSYYDQVADQIQRLGCVPKRFAKQSNALDQYFNMVRGYETFALEMTKWFDTNYHYLVPEFDSQTTFDLNIDELLNQVREAKQLNHPIKVQLIGPVTFLHLGKVKERGFDVLSLLKPLLTQYHQLLKTLADEGVQWVQLDEPALSTDLPSDWQLALEQAYAHLQSVSIKKMVATYFDSTAGHTGLLCRLPVQAIHLDCVRASEDLPVVLDWLPNYRILSLGLVDGRNIWKTNLDAATPLISACFNSGRKDLWLAPSCSLLHVPYSFAAEHALPTPVKNWLAGVDEKLTELSWLKSQVKAKFEGVLINQHVVQQIKHHQQIIDERAHHLIVKDAEVQARQSAITEQDSLRTSHFATRQKLQRDTLKLPLLPTTTIGSFPQTPELRSKRAQWRKQHLSQSDYNRYIKQEIQSAIQTQESLGLDVLVHGEAERTDMVEFFGQQLKGFAFTEKAWVQSYGSRCVKPPVLFGDVSRPSAMTVELAQYAQSLTDKPVKGMLTGPITILQWSFVRDDQPRQTTAEQIAMAIADEVRDLEHAGIRIIQIDEPAFREGLPIRQAKQKEYLAWASRAFRLSSQGVKDSTQIHTHMCYSEFNDILDHIASLDADVITIETSRSDMELLHAFGEFEYPNEIGPGVYDIHSPKVPSVEQMVKLLQKATQVLPVQNLWVNPDCGLKTRDWPETKSALENMVNAAKKLRQETLNQRSVA